MGCEVMYDDELLMKDYIEIIRLISNGKLNNENALIMIKSLESIFSPYKIHAVIFKLDHNREHFVKLAGSSIPHHHKNISDIHDKKKYKFSEKFISYFEEPLFIPNIYEDYRWNEYKEIADTFLFKSSWTIPLESSTNELLGIVTIGFYDFYTPDIVTVKNLNKYSRLISVALELLNSLEEKQNGKLTNVGNDSIVSRNEDEITLTDLKNALKKEQFIIYYQPYFSLKNNEIGVEALIRWNHPEKGLLLPGLFLNIAEKTDFILELEKWVLNQAISDAKTLKAEGFSNINVSVNISANQLNVKSFPDTVHNILKNHSFKPENLTLEITERFLVEPQSVGALKKLKNKGVRISIDDFGTAYSSLHYLKSLPIDELKIDRSFIADITTDKINKNIVEAIIKLGNDLNLTVVAEGVETKEQLNLLKNMKCSRVQGFYFSKPVPLDKFILKYKNKSYEIV